MGVTKKPASTPPGKPQPARKSGTATDAPVGAEAKDVGAALEPGEAARVALGDVPPAGAAPQAEGPEPPRGPRGPVAKVRPKRKYTKRASVRPASPEKAPGGKPAAAQLPRGQHAAGFAVAITVMHMGLAARVPEMALLPGEAEQLGAALDGVCKEFGYKPSTKAAALLTLAGTALMVYGPKVAAVRANRPAKRKPAQAAPTPPPQAQPEGVPEMTAEDWEAVQLLASQAPRGDEGVH